MGSLRHFALIVFLAGVGWAVYVALHKPPKSLDRLDVAPAWNPPQLNMGLAAGPPVGDNNKTGLPPLLVPSPSTTATAPSAAVAGGSVSAAATATATSTSGSLAAIAATTVSSSASAPPAAAATPTTSSSASAAPAQPYASATAPTGAPATPQKALDEPGFATVAGGAGLPSAAASQGPPPGAPPAAGTPSAASLASAVSSLAAAPPAATPPMATPPTATPPAATPPAATPPAGTPLTAPPPSQPPASAAAAVPPQSPQGGATPLAEALQAARGPLEAGRFAEALTILSKFYRNALATPALSADDSQQLVSILDQLAGTVVYSREHLLAPPHRVQPGETVDSIARRYNLSAELLAKINGLRDAAQLAPGVELKVVPGPFEAIVDLNRYELALFVGECYAGRFPVGFGQDQPLAEGQFVVREKQLNPFYRGVDRIFTGGDPSNPLGRRKLDLGGAIAIHGTDDPRNIGRTEGRGAIRLGERDIADVYDILTVGSVVTLRR